jgi:hypothetical protein
VQPIIVQATGNGEADVGCTDAMTCANASDGAFLPDDKHSAWQILAPIMGLYHVRGGHSAVLLRQAHDQFCGARLRFVHFYLPADEPSCRPAPSEARAPPSGRGLKRRGKLRFGLSPTQSAKRSMRLFAERVMPRVRAP